MTATQNPARRTGAAAGWTAGLSVFAALMLLMTGVLQALEGIAVLAGRSYFVVSSDYVYRLNTTAWGIAHLLLGVLAVVIGLGILQGAGAARFGGMAVAFVSAVANFLFIPYYPLWAILLVALDVAVIWALAGFEPRKR